MASRLVRIVSFVRLIVALSVRKSCSAFSSWTLTPLRRVSATASARFDFMATPAYIVSLLGRWRSTVEAVEFGNVFCRFTGV